MEKFIIPKDYHSEFPYIMKLNRHFTTPSEVIRAYLSAKPFSGIWHIVNISPNVRFISQNI